LGIGSLSLNLSVVFLPPKINVNIHQNLSGMIVCILIGCFGWLLEAVGGALIGKNPGDSFGKWK